jgi:hypothetical protein
MLKSVERREWWHKGDCFMFVNEDDGLRDGVVVVLKMMMKA